MEKNQVNRAFAASIGVAFALAALISLLDPLLDAVPHPPDRGPSWYFWRLTEPSAWTRLAAWGGYALHQVSIWIVVILMMGEKPHPGRLSRLNLAALAINLVFILLHVLKTHVTYDGTAQDLPVWSSQWSVIVMLFLVVYLMTPARGFILGKRVPWSPGALRWAGKWHGLYISWALVYTFWFHPAEGDFGLLLGFLYMFLLLIQLSFANTEVHFRKGWILILELMVGFHGPAISIQKMLEGNGGRLQPGSWIMFATGFLFMFVFTGQYALRLKTWARGLVFLGYAALATGLYAWWGFGYAYRLVFIPAALYGCALGFGALAELASRLGGRLGGGGRASAGPG